MLMNNNIFDRTYKGLIAVFGCFIALFVVSISNMNVHATETTIYPNYFAEYDCNSDGNIDNSDIPLMQTQVLSSNAQITDLVRLYHIVLNKSAYKVYYAKDLTISETNSMFLRNFYTSDFSRSVSSSEAVLVENFSAENGGYQIVWDASMLTFNKVLNRTDPTSGYIAAWTDFSTNTVYEVYKQKTSYMLNIRLPLAPPITRYNFYDTITEAQEELVRNLFNTTEYTLVNLKVDAGSVNYFFKKLSNNAEIVLSVPVTNSATEGATIADFAFNGVYYSLIKNSQNKLQVIVS